jgi:hypothetical protein
MIDRSTVTELFWTCPGCNHVNPKKRKGCTQCPEGKPETVLPVEIIRVQLRVNHILLNDLRTDMIVTTYDNRILRIASNKPGLIKDVEALAEFDDKVTGSYNELGSVYGFEIRSLILEDRRTTVPVKLTRKQTQQAHEIRAMLRSS